ncbi:MAG TPA: MATE family efflux transporter, partial [Ruminococcaceae bacterium]|nr:MATE family efflux transporter [Oscillospiraceae bacterium]
LLGVKGAAIATVMSRYVEFGLLAVYYFIKRNRFRYVQGAFSSIRIPKNVLSQIAKKGLPLLLNEFFWSSGMTLLSSGYSLHGLTVMAGYSISSTVVNLFTIAFISFGSAIGIIIGKQLGANEFDNAVDSCRKLSTFAVMMSLGITLIVVLFGYKIPLLYNTTEQSKEYAMYFIRISSVFFPFTAFANSSYFTLRSGGKTGITIIYDSVFIMAVSVPTVFLLYYAAHLNIWQVYPIVQSLEIIKCIIGYAFLKKRIWVNNIVSDDEAQKGEVVCV